MAKVPETRLWSWLSGTTKKHFKHDLHLNRIENSVSQGMPDVEGCLRRVQFWIELKCEKRPANWGTKVRPKFRPAQPPWLRRRIEAGGRAFVLLQVGAGRDARRYLVRGDLADEMAAGVTEDWLESVSFVNPKAAARSIISAAALAKF